MRPLVEKFLATAARLIIRKYHPLIIGITGSVGKTSTRAAVYAVVAAKERAYTPPKNLNDKIGLPLGVIGCDSPGSSLWGWIEIFGKLAWLLLYKTAQYPKILVLEYGIDRVGEMDELISIARPDIAILTTIGLSHYEFFQDPAVLEHEKSRLITALPSEGTAILNADNPAALRQQDKTRARIITYGSKEADINLQRLEETLSEKPVSHLEIKTPTGPLSLSIPCLGQTHISSVLAAVAVAEILKIEHSLIRKGLEQYRPVPGRLNVIAGLKRSILIDDTYNASPDSTKEALHVFERFAAAHKIAVLGDMLELGKISNLEHEKIGQMVAKISPTHLVTVGAGGKIIAFSALEAGLPEERVVSFDTAADARLTVQSLIREGSITLIKGSQGMRMERITKEIMAEPMAATELLCRQYGKWLEN